MPWPDLTAAPPGLLALLRRIDRPQTGPRRRRELCRRALARVRRGERPRLWAALQVELGSDWIEDPEADPETAVERALEAFRRALSEPGAGARLRAAALANLGFCFTVRARGNPDRNLEAAISHDREAMTLLDPDDPELWGATAHRLATNLLGRSGGDREDDLGEAGELFEQALGIRSREREPLEWVSSRKGLAVVDAQRVRGDRTANRERAIDGFREVLEIVSRDRHPGLWAEAWSNLGNVYAQRLAGDPEDNRGDAVAAYRRALEVFSRQEDPERWARATLGLANVLHERAEAGDGDPVEDIEAAAASLRAVLEVLDRHRDPAAWATAQDDLGIALGARRHGDPEENRRAAAEAHRAALGVWKRGSWQWARSRLALGGLYAEPPPGSGPPDRRRAARNLRAAAAASPLEAHPQRHRLAQQNLGHLWFAARRWRAAERAYAAALEASEILYRRGASRDSSHAELREDLEIPVRRAYALARRGRLEEAVETLERGRARSIAEALARHHAGPPPAAPPAEPHVYLLPTPHGSLALIVRPPDPVRALWLNSFTDETARALDEDEGGFLDSVTRGDAGGTRRALDIAWPCWRRLMRPVAGRLRRLGGAPAALIPCGRFALWPLAAVASEWIELTVVPSARVLSAALGEREVRRGRPPALLAVARPGSGGRRLPAVGSEVERAAAAFPRARVLRGSEATREAVAAALPQATHLHFACHGAFDVRRPLDSTLDLAGGPLTLRELLDGGLELGGVQLVVLSACDSGRIESRSLLDEAIGFPGALLQAGIPNVVGGLWRVDDLAATCLVEGFYDALLRRGLASLDALAAARDRLRGATAAELDLAGRCRRLLDEPLPLPLRRALYGRLRRAEARPDERPFRHPFYWAAFAVSGAPSVSRASGSA